MGKENNGFVAMLISLTVIIVTLLLILIVPLLDKDNIEEYNTTFNKGSGASSITVDTPFLFSLMTDLTGKNVSIKPDSKYQLGDYIDGLKKDVILYGENALHDIDFSMEKNAPSLPAGYKERKDNVFMRNYFMNPTNGRIILDEIYEKIPKYEENYKRINKELDKVESSFENMGKDFSNPAIFFVGETYNIGWFQNLNKNIKIFSLKDSKSEKTSDTYELFLKVCEKYGVTKILADKDIDPEVIALLRRDIDGLEVIYLHSDENFNSLYDFYMENYMKMNNSVINLK